MTPPFVKVFADCWKDPLWEDTLAFRLLLLLRADAAIRDSAVIRFAYPTYQDRLAYRDPANWSRKIFPPRRALRAALLRLQAMQLVVIPPGTDGNSENGNKLSTRQGQGGVQGWFAVTVVGYESYRNAKLDRGTGRGTGTRNRGQPEVRGEVRGEVQGDVQAAVQGSRTVTSAGFASYDAAEPTEVRGEVRGEVQCEDDPRLTRGTPRIEEIDRENYIESVHAHSEEAPQNRKSDAIPYEQLREAWNAAARRHGLPQVVSVVGAKRRELLRGFWVEAGSNLARCASAFEAAAEVYARMHRLNGGRRYGLFNVVLPRNRVKWISLAEDPAPQPAKWEPPPEEIEER